MRVKTKGPKTDRRYQLQFTVSPPAFALMRKMQRETQQRPGQVLEGLLYAAEAREEGRQEERARILGLLTAEAS